MLTRCQTPMWKEDPDKAAMINDACEFIEPEEIADGMYELLTDEAHGDGTIFECSKGSRRVVPLFGNTPPHGKVAAMPGYIESIDDLYAQLQKDGLRV